MDALVPVVVGGLIAIAGGLVGAWFQGQREHAKWLRERRLEAYLGMLLVARDLIDSIDANDAHEAGIADGVARAERIEQAIPSAAGDPAKVAELKRENEAILADARTRQKQLDDERAASRALIDRINAKVSAFDLLGPAQVREASSAILGAQPEGTKVMRARVRALESAMRGALKIRD